MAESTELSSALPADLQRWLDSDLISADQARAIAAFEAQRSQTNGQGRTTRAIALLGGLTLVSGVGSLVAYNWDKFGDGVKLLAMGVLLALSFAFVLRARRDQRAQLSVALDVGLVVTQGLTLAALALVSQIYAQDGELWVLLFAWCALTSPLMSFARTRFAHWVWYAGLFGSLLTAGEAFDDFLRDSIKLSYGVSEMTTALCFAGLAGLLAVRFAASRHVGRAAVGLTLFRWQLLSLGLFGGLFWLHGGDGEPVLFATGLVASGLVALASPSNLKHLGFGDRSQALGLWGLGSALALVPMLLPVESGFAAFAAFVTFWAAAWFLAERAGHAKNARFAVGVIGIRIVIASFELFESMLVTGLVLMALGGAALFWSKLKWTPAADGGAS